eukprot:1818248-Pleurochrysis_carterae.AAC.1
MQMLSERYEAAFSLVDSIGTDRDFDVEERALFHVLVEAASGNNGHGGQRQPHPNASACLCKIALAIEDSPVLMPVSLGAVAARYVASLQLVSTECRLSAQEELRLMELTREEEVLRDAVFKVARQYESNVLARAVEPASLSPASRVLSPEQRMVQALHREVRAPGCR